MNDMKGAFEMTTSALFEQRFWLQIMGDHARFIYNALSPKQVQPIHDAQQYIQSFDHLLALARSDAAAAQLASLNQQAYTLTVQFRAFKLDLLRNVLLGSITVGLTPTFFNHMLNELEEYLRILTALVEGKPVPLFSALHHDLLWLPDAAGHAASIASDLDSVEQRLIQKSGKFEKHFQGLYLKSIEMAGYMRTQLSEFPAFQRFHHEIDLEMKLFVAFLQEIEQMVVSAEALDRLSPLIPDHMTREECYYLTKLAQLGMVPNPECNPAKPRVEA
ncbi:MAG: hypothetical protein K0Q59_2035 [Paenibacillus sp.]|jgi:hypothetical protein|nr:hypothetical protein [Paenibacillus sp.]